MLTHVLTHVCVLSLIILSAVQAAQVDLYSALPDNMLRSATPTKYTFILKMDGDLAAGSVITLDTTKAIDGAVASQSMWTGNGDAACVAQDFIDANDNTVSANTADLTGVVADQGSGCTTTSGGADRTTETNCGSGGDRPCNNKAYCEAVSGTTWTPERLVLTVHETNPLLAGKLTAGKGTRTIVCGTSKLAANPTYGQIDISLATVTSKTVSTCDGQPTESLCAVQFRVSAMNCRVCIVTGATNTPDQCTVTGCVGPLVTAGSSTVPANCAGYPCTQAEFGGASSTCCYLPPRKSMTKNERSQIIQNC